MSAIDGLIIELDQEAKTTRRLLDRVPEERLTWKPHEKSLSLGQLALHVASIPGNVGNMVMAEGFDVKTRKMDYAMPSSKVQILDALEASVSNAKKILSGLTQEAAMAPWKLTAGDREVFTIPRIGVVRNIMLNHSYHHRGQLTVYLRLLNVPLPVTYGRSADESPFG